MEIYLNIIGRRSRRRSRLKEWRFPISLIIFLLLFLCFFSTYITTHNPQILSDAMRILTIEADHISYKNSRSFKIGANNSMRSRIGGGRRLLGGLGSSPPRCTSKCGGCTPCKAVHVPVPPGTPVTTEYYPEAWRCKCRNKFYIP